jgi:muramidase (phage lysozyme)
MANLLKDNWKYIIAGLAAPALLVFLGGKLKASSPVAKNNPYANLRAFLTMIQYAEGTYGKNAYRMLYGGQLFSGYGRHPDIAVTRGGLTSTAAGAYQVLYRTWVSVQQTTGLTDFTPLSQDRAAVELISRRGALADVLAGRLETAIEKCCKEWASLPGAGYGQREQTFTWLAQVYQGAGGRMTE